ncbi:MAG TPA: hypothetical protein VGD89_07270 [Flavipsychrobacter sp.]
MKYSLIAACLLVAGSSFAQDKMNYEHYNRITEIPGTDYVYATAEHMGKRSSGADFLMFINTRTGETRKVDFPNGSEIHEIKQLKYDSIGLHKLMVLGKTVDLNDKGGISYGDPRQVIIVSVDGKEKTVITEDGYYVKHWYISPSHGTITVLGYYDSNSNGRLDKSDKSETIVYDLKKMKLLSKT